jgi:hypothetical protein
MGTQNYGKMEMESLKEGGRQMNPVKEFKGGNSTVRSTPNGEKHVANLNLKKGCKRSKRCQCGPEVETNKQARVILHNPK